MYEELGEESLEVYVLDDIDDGGEVLVPEAGRHDLSIWSHLHSQDLQAALFPTATAEPELETVSEEDREIHQRLHRRWAAILVTIARG